MSTNDRKSFLELITTLGRRICPRCGAANIPIVVSEADPTIARQARPGDATVCTVCERVLLFIGEALEMREPTQEQYIALVENEAVWDRIRQKRIANQEAKQTMKELLVDLLGLDQAAADRIINSHHQGGSR